MFYKSIDSKFRHIQCIAHRLYLIIHNTFDLWTSTNNQNNETIYLMKITTPQLLKFNKTVSTICSLFFQFESCKILQNKFHFQKQTNKYCLIFHFWSRRKIIIESRWMLEFRSKILHLNKVLHWKALG